MRFTVEIFRDDNLPLFDGLTISQNASIVVLVVTVALFVIGRIKLKGQTTLSEGFVRAIHELPLQVGL
jgi:prolipoprotein diacylglyceryltransferase